MSRARGNLGADGSGQPGLTYKTASLSQYRLYNRYQAFFLLIIIQQGRSSSEYSIGMPNSAILIATLGTEAQVVTTTYDLLHARGERITQVRVLHTAAPAPALAQAVERLRALAEPPLELIPILSSTGVPLEDVETAPAAEAAFRLLYRQVWQAKREGHKVHLSIAGGRKSLAVFGMAVAQMLFDEEDCLWHLYSGGEFLASKRLHPGPGDDAFLMRLPVILWSQVSPTAGLLQQVADPYQALEQIRRLQWEEKITQARSFCLGALTTAERRAVELLVREGLADSEIAAHLVLSPRTVEQHLRSAYSKAAAHWEVDQVGRTQLVALLSLFFNTQIPGKPA